MQCFQCQHDHPSDARFCHQYAACGHANPADAKFCNPCGTSLIAPTSVIRSVQSRPQEAEAEGRFQAALTAVMTTLQRERRVTYRELGMDTGRTESAGSGRGADPPGIGQ
jgi:hypothetical protein